MAMDLISQKELKAMILKYEMKMISRLTLIVFIKVLLERLYIVLSEEIC